MPFHNIIVAKHYLIGADVFQMPTPSFRITLRIYVLELSSPMTFGIWSPVTDAVISISSDYYALKFIGKVKQF